jgi:hypothetical protein
MASAGVLPHRCGMTRPEAGSATMRKAELNIDA